MPFAKLLRYLVERKWPVARKAGGGLTGVGCVDEATTSEATERVVPWYLIAGISLDGGSSPTAGLN